MVEPELLSVENRVTYKAGVGVHRLQPATILWLSDAEIIKCIGDNQYLAEYNGVRCTAIFNFFTRRYYG